MGTENDTKSPPWSDESRRESARAAPAWVQVRASAWPPEPIDDHDDPVDDEGDSPTTVSWGFPGNPVIAPTTAPAVAAFAARAEPKASVRPPPPAPHDDEPVGVAPVARRQSKRSSMGTPDFLDRAAPRTPADRTPSPRAYYSNPAARPAAEEPRSNMTPPRDTRGGRRSEEPSKERRVAEATGPQAGRRGPGERDYESKGTDVGFGGMRAAPPARGAQPMPAPSSSRMFDDDDPDKSDAWSSYSPPKPKRPRGNAAPPLVTPARQPVTAGGVNFSFLARVVLGIGLLMGAGALAITLMPRSSNTQVASGEAPMLPVVGGAIPAADPPPPFDVQAPAAFRPQLLDGKDVSVEMIPEALAQARADGKLDLAAAYADKLARTASDPATFFPLGELLAQNGQTDAAFYWLVRGVHEFGARPERFVERQAFASLWTDARWDAFARWAVQVRRYQTSKGSAAPRVILPSSIEAAVALDAARHAGEPRPRGGRGKAMLPVLFWFDPADGTGSQVQAWGQAVADELGVIVVNVLGPDRVGPMASAWSGDPARDRAQVDAALAAITNVTPDATRRYAAGIGQGGTWGVELAMRDPKFLAGTLALHPTDEWRGPRDTSAESNRDRKQTVTLLAGGKDEDEHAFLRVERGRLLRAGVEAVMEIDEKAWPDNVPTDLKARLSTWMLARLSPSPNAALPPAAAPGLPSVPSP